MYCGLVELKKVAKCNIEIEVSRYRCAWLLLLIIYRHLVIRWLLFDVSLHAYDFHSYFPLSGESFQIQQGEDKSDLTSFFCKIRLTFFQLIFVRTSNAREVL